MIPKTPPSVPESEGFFGNSTLERIKAYIDNHEPTLEEELIFEINCLDSKLKFIKASINKGFSREVVLSDITNALLAVNSFVNICEAIADEYSKE